MTESLMRIVDVAGALLLTLFGVTILYFGFMPWLSTLPGGHIDEGNSSVGQLVLRAPNRFDRSVLSGDYLQRDFIEIDVVTKSPGLYRMQITGSSDNNCVWKAKLMVDNGPERQMSVISPVASEKNIKKITAEVELSENPRHIKVVPVEKSKCQINGFTGVSFELLSSSGNELLKK